jgi:hypothetical protein
MPVKKGEARNTYRRYRIICAVCERPFQARRKDAKTCGPRCRQFQSRNGRGLICGVSWKLRERRRAALVSYLAS